MLIFRILCVILVIAFGQTAISYDDIDIKLLEDVSFVSEVERRLENVKQEILIAKVSTAPTAVASLVPYVGQSIVSGIQCSTEAYSKASYERMLVGAISDATELNIANSISDRINSDMNTISQLFRDLNETIGLPNVSKVAIVHDIRTEILRQINYFTVGDRIFRKYPQIAIPPLYVLAPLIITFDSIMGQIIPSIAKTSYLSCRLERILRKYQRLVIINRLSNLKGAGTIMLDEIDHIDQKIKWAASFIMSQPYNQYGYNKTNEGTIECSRKGCFDLSADDKSAGHCFKDEHTETEFKFLKIKDYTFTEAPQYDASNCIAGYMEIIRFRVEKTFEGPINSISTICTQSIRNQRIRTGFGWWTIIVNRILVQKFDRSFDPMYAVFGAHAHHCNPWMKVIVDENEVFRTSRPLWKPEAYFFEVYSSEKMKKTSNIRFEVYHSDRNLIGSENNYLVLSWTTKIDQLSIDTERTDGKNSFSLLSFWEDEYIDD